jgi:hypothetical protein
VVDDELIPSEKDVCGGRRESLITAGFLGGLEGLVGNGMRAETAVGSVLTVSCDGVEASMPILVNERGRGSSSSMV